MSNLEISRAKRLDQRVIELVPELSRSYAAKLIEDGKVKVNGDTVLKAGHKLRDGDIVKVDFDITKIKTPEIDLQVLYEDDDCVVINKPEGLLTHSKGELNPEPTVETWLRSRTKLSGYRAGIVHRLDRATSGVMICAKTPEALKWLQKQFSQRKVKKTYISIIEGHIDPPEAVIDMPIERNPKAPATFRAGVNGKPAVTSYKVLKKSNKYSLVELKPETGRTHQLRVHLKQIGHPIVGDGFYGGIRAERMLLHALSLEVTLPNHERKIFSTELPPIFDNFMQDDS